jgi:uncharacterized protein YjdB
MNFFSRNKALVAVGLGALSALAACGDNVTVPVTQNQVVISISPSNASLNINDTQIFSVQITGGSTSTPPTLASCSSSNAAVVTVTKGTNSCSVTAVAAGNATITAVSSTNQQASAAVSVTAASAGINTLTLSPTAVNLAPAQTVTITPNVVKANPAAVVTYSYATSNPAIASIGAPGANGAVVVTALTPGVATITATATTPSGSGYAASNLTAATTVTVGAFPSGITSLTVQPTSLNLAVGRTAGLTASVVQPSGANAATYKYTSSNTAVASVDTNGVVTAIAPGTSSITVTATSTANTANGFQTSTLTQVVPVTVSPVANVSIQAINQGPYVTTGLDSAYNAASYATNQVVQGFAGSGPVGAPMGVIAGIRRSLNPQVGQPIDVTNTKDQIQVILNLQANGQRVDSVVVYIDSGATGTSTVRRAAARQIFTNGDAGSSQTVSIEAFILTEDFTANDVTGNGDVAYVNGLKRISASVFTTLSQGQTCVANGTPAPNNTTPCELQNAANIRQNVNFNNIDGFALKMMNPANSAVDANGRTWWGGPTVSDIGQPSGLGQFQTYPVIFTPGRSIQRVSATFGRCLGFGVDGIPNFVTDSAGPWIFQFGKTAPASPAASSKFISCAGIVGAYDVGDQYRFEDYPMVVASLDNSNNPGPRTLYAYNPAQGPDAFAGPRPTLFRSSPQLVNPNAIRIDYENPTLTLAVTNSNLERFVNDSYLFNTNYTATDMPTFPATSVYPGAGVGLLSTRNTSFSVASANVNCGPQTFQAIPGTLATASIANVFSIAPNTNRESPCDFTNNAFVAQATETDRLGNRGTIGTLPTGTTNGSPLFGIDNTAPTAVVSYSASNLIPSTPNMYQATGDSIFQPVNGAVAATPIATAGNATDFYFGVRYRDERSGFNITNHGTRTVKRFAPAASPILSDRAVVTTVSTRTLNFLGGTGNPVENEDPTFRRDSVLIYGAGALGGSNGNGSGTGFAPTANPLPGYYLYTFTVTDRAGNTASITEHAVIDATNPQVTGATIPALFGVNSGTAVTQVFQPTGTDDVEAIDYDFFLRYGALAMVGDSSSGSTVITDGARLRFRRDKIPNPHFAWAVYGDTLLNTPFGPGAYFSNNQIQTPIASMRGIEPVDSTNAPIAYGSGATNPFSGFKPTAFGAYAFDVRAEHKGTGFPAPYAASLPFNSLGMTNTFPSTATPGVGEAAFVVPMFAGNIANGARWDTKDLNPATTGLDRLVSWAGFGATGSTIEFRATTSTVVTQAPFPIVHLLKWEPDAQHTGSTAVSAQTTLGDSAVGQWIYIGTVNASAPSNPAVNDQGATRFWRYFFTAAAFPSVTNGSIIQAGVTTGCYRAVGVDLLGDGISTTSFGTGCPSTVGTLANQIQVVAGAVNPTVTLRAYGNGSGTIAATTGVLPFQLTKLATNSVERTSLNRAGASELFTITPTGGSTIDRTPMGCTPTTPVVFPTPNAFNCSTSTAVGYTVTVIFELPSAGAP